MKCFLRDQGLKDNKDDMIKYLVVDDVYKDRVAVVYIELLYIQILKS